MLQSASPSSGTAVDEVVWVLDVAEVWSFWDIVNMRSFSDDIVSVWSLKDVWLLDVVEGVISLPRRILFTTTSGAGHCGIIYETPSYLPIHAIEKFFIDRFSDYYFLVGNDDDIVKCGHVPNDLSCCSKITSVF